MHSYAVMHSYAGHNCLYCAVHSCAETMHTLWLEIVMVLRIANQSALFQGYATIVYDIVSRVGSVNTLE